MKHPRQVKFPNCPNFFTGEWPLLWLFYNNPIVKCAGCGYVRPTQTAGGK